MMSGQISLSMIECSQYSKTGIWHFATKGCATDMLVQPENLSWTYSISTNRQGPKKSFKALEFSPADLPGKQGAAERKICAGVRVVLCLYLTGCTRSAQ